MEYLECSHCGAFVSRGLPECSSCMAQIRYGTSWSAIIILAVISLTVGFKAAEIVPDRYSFIGWILGWLFSIAFFVPANVVLNRIFRYRVKFKMAYREHGLPR
ncbi:hypothetical protein [Collimonas humicola]|uniref:hypothetical protein n=1 Tax=Collimonas humicola TaxID=2825886 RepID=UPI001B8B8C6E|nr:hypothetical protein [Collimonas humicola]